MGQTSGGQNITKIGRIKVFETMPFDNLIADQDTSRLWIKRVRTSAFFDRGKTWVLSFNRRKGVE
jgi:hypothetical protein